VFTANSLKDAIIQRFGYLTLEDTLPLYRRAIAPWYPVISIPRLQSQIPQSWEQASLDVALLCLSIVLLTTPPTSSPESGDSLWEFKSLYCHMKTWISSTEALGLNSFQIVQARILVTLYEVAHGLYPAAYISVGATANAADALIIHSRAGAQPLRAADDETKREDSVLIWCAILILDRYGLFDVWTICLLIPY
jgi:hypothetical protein